MSVDKGTWDHSQGVRADHAFHLEWLAACQRVLKPSGTLWVSGTQHAIFSIGYAMQELGFHLLNTVTWYKPNAAPNLACRMFTHSTELLIWASPMRSQPLAHRFNYQDMKSTNGGKQMRDVWQMPEDEPHLVWSIPTPSAGEKQCGKHPAQKPIALYERCILASTQPGDLVLDPFCGSGTSGVAAYLHGRSYIGIDQDRQWLDVAAARLRDTGGHHG